MSKITHLLQFCPHGRLDRDHIVSGARGITGSEQALMAFAKASAVEGHRVVVYVPTTGDFLHEGVWYKDSLSRWPRLEDLDDSDCVVAWLSADPLLRVNPNALRVMVLQINDWGMCATTDTRFRHVDVFVVQSEPHVESLWQKPFHPNDRDRTVVIPNGIQLSRFSTPLPRIKDRLVACSSPDRGLHWMLYLWPQIKQAVPNATLHIFYEVKKWADMAILSANEIGQRARYMLDVLPGLESHGVVLRGAVAPEEIAQELLRADLMVYPCDSLQFTEGFCIAKGTKILTNRGVRDVEHVEPGDLVIGSRGSRSEVTRVYSRRHVGKIMKLTVPGCAGPLYLTPEHQVLIAGPGRQRKWVMATDRPKHVAMELPCEKDVPETLDILRLASIVANIRTEKLAEDDSGMIRFKTKGQHKAIPRHVPITEDLCELLGWYLAEGTASLMSNATLFSLGAHEPQNAARICELVWSIFQQKAVSITKGNKICVRVCSRMIAASLIGICGHGAKSKQVPFWAFGLPASKRRALVSSLYKGDGTLRTNKKSRFLRSECKSLVLTTTSQNLAYGVRILLLQDRCRVGIYHNPRRGSWDVGTNVRRAPWLAAAMGHTVQKPWVEKYVGTSRRIFRQDGLISLKASWSEEDYDGEVFDLSVPESLCYMAGPITVHNSCSTMEACAAGAVPIITDVDALGEIYQDSGAVIVPRTHNGTWIDAYRDAVVGMLNTGQDPQDPLPMSLDARRTKCRTFAAQYDYGLVGKRFHDMLEVNMAEKRKGDLYERTVVEYPGTRLAGRHSVSDVRADGSVDTQS